jgi:hypothetical protein
VSTVSGKLFTGQGDLALTEAGRLTRAKRPEAVNAIIAIGQESIAPH